MEKMEIETGYGLGHGPYSKLLGNLNFGELLKSYINVGRGFTSISSNGHFISNVEGKIINCKENKLINFDVNISSYADVSISPEGEYFAIVTGREVKFFNRKAGELWHQELDEEIKSKGGMSRNGEHVQTVSGNVLIESNHISVSSNGEYIAVADCMSNIYLFDKKGKLVWRVDSDQEEYAEGTSGAVAISPDGSFIATYQSSIFKIRGEYPKIHKIQLLSINGKIIWEYGTRESNEVGSSNFTSISISSNGKYVVMGEKLRGQYVNNHDGCVVLLNADGEMLWEYITEGAVGSVSISSDGQYITMLHNGTEISLLDLQGHLIWQCHMYDSRNDYGPSDSATSVSISADGTYIVVSTHSGNVHIFKNHIHDIVEMSSWGPEISTSSLLPFDPNEPVRI